MMDYLTQELGLSQEMADSICERFSAALQERDDALSHAENALHALESEYAVHRKESAISCALSDAGAKNLTAARALIDEETLTEEEGVFSGLSEQIERMKQDCPYLFRGAEFSGANGKSGGMRHGPEGAAVDSFTQFARAGAKLK